MKNTPLNKRGVNIWNFEYAVKQHFAAAKGLAIKPPPLRFSQAFLCCSTHCPYALIKLCRNGLTDSDNLPASSNAEPAPPR